MARESNEETNMKVEGQWHCGELSFEAEIDPETVRICHCTDCQTITGAAYRVNVTATAEHFRLRTGRPKIYTRIAESGNRGEDTIRAFKHVKPRQRTALDRDRSRPSVEEARYSAKADSCAADHPNGNRYNAARTKSMHTATLRPAVWLNSNKGT
jgi:hypothetical protein